MMSRPKNQLTEEQKRLRNAEYKRNQRKREAIKPSTADPTDLAKLKADIETYCGRRGMLKEARNKITGPAFQDWSNDEFSAIDRTHAHKFVLKELVYNEVQEAARLKAKAQAFYDANIKPFKRIPKALQDALDEGILSSKRFPVGDDRKSNYPHLDDNLTKIMDSLPIEESEIEDLKSQCRDAYRDKTCAGFYPNPSQWRKNVRGITLRYESKEQFDTVLDAQINNVVRTVEENPDHAPVDPKKYLNMIQRDIETARYFSSGENLKRCADFAKVFDAHEACDPAPKPKKSNVFKFLKRKTS